MATALGPNDLKARFTGLKKSLAWHDAVALYHQLRVHADGEMPINLIKNARPNESEAVQKYRQSIYEPETQNPVERVLGVLEKIRRSPDWMIRFDSEVPAIIPKDETLQRYITEKYPMYDSIENWLFEEALKNVALDANAVCVILPKSFEVVNEFIQPIAQIYNANKVVDFAADDYCIVMSEEYSSLLSPDMQQTRQGSMLSAVASKIAPNADMPASQCYPQVAQVYYVITTQYYQKWEETEEGKHQLTKQFAHNLNQLPAFQLPGKYYRRMGNSIIKKTPLYAMVPHLNKAARESNDLDAGVIMHLFPERWRINNVQCNTCNGTGIVPNGGAKGECKSCEGTGMSKSKSPFGEILIKPSSVLNGGNIPIPPVGYVQKDSTIIEVQNARVKEHIGKALAAINMDHLNDTQLNQSGAAKAFDRDEFNNLIYYFAECLCYVANTVVYFINELRYSGLVSDSEKRKAMLPVIPVPEKFDVVNTTFLLQEYQTAKTAGLNSTILAELQKEIAQKKFYANPQVSQFVQTVMDLDPFPDKTIEEKSLLEAQQLATKEDVILSNYISDFVRQAQEEDVKFLEKTKTQKKAILLKYAKAKSDELNTAKQLQADMFQQDQQQQIQQANSTTKMMSSVQNATL